MLLGCNPGKSPLEMVVVFLFGFSPYTEPKLGTLNKEDTDTVSPMLANSACPLVSRFAAHLQPNPQR